MHLDVTGIKVCMYLRMDMYHKSHPHTHLHSKFSQVVGLIGNGVEIGLPICNQDSHFGNPF